MQISKILHGGDYNPEQWLDSPEILKKDIEYMKAAHINTVSMGMFSWSSLEPSEGEFKFDWLENVVETLYENGIYTILATPSGARPKWLADKYPEVLRVDENRNRNLFGGRHNHCYTSPIYREKVRIINQKLVEHFGENKAIILWHISNEYGGECHCPLCQEAFRNWLKKKYQTIENLNKKWSTTFWSHTYQNFDQIESPSPRGEMALHALTIDWKRFVTDQTKDFMESEIAAIKDAGSNLPVTTNMMYYYDGLNYHKFADSVDIISWDSYPTWHKEKESLTAMDNGMQHDIMRSIKKAPFLLMESCPSSTNWQSVSKLKRPKMLQAASLQAIAHGSDSVLYFQIRQSRGSSEKFHGAVIDHYGGNDTRVFSEVTKTGEMLEKLKNVIGSNMHSDVAVIYDWENKWALEDSMGPRNKGMHYKEHVEKSYSAFRKLGLNVDVIDMEQEIKEYKIVAAPMLYMFRADFEQKVQEFVKNGGCFILTQWSGVADDTDRCFLGGRPYNLMEVMGLRCTEIDALYDGESNVLISTEKFISDKEYKTTNLCDLIQLKGAEVLMNYGEDFYQGTPAVTKNKFGEGCAYYIGTDAEQALFDDLYSQIAQENNVSNVLNLKVPQGVEMTVRQNENGVYIFLQNFNQENVQITGISEELEWIVGDNSKENSKEMKPYEGWVLRKMSFC